MGKKLTDGQIESFQRDGFLSPVDIYTEEEAAALVVRTPGATPSDGVPPLLYSVPCRRQKQNQIDCWVVSCDCRYSS